MDRSGIDGQPGPRNRLEEQISPGDLDQHEALILIEAGGLELGPHDVAAAQLAARALDEVVDPLLRVQALVEMLVPREDDGDAVPDEERLEDNAQLHRRAVLTTVRVQWVVEIADLPLVG